MSVRLLAFAGYQTSGKDTAIRGLMGFGRMRSTIGEVVRREGVEAAIRPASTRRIEWAGEIKRSVREWYGLSEEQFEGSLKDVVDPRYGKTPRQIMRLLGTEVARQIYADTWVRWLMDTELPRAVRDSRRALATLMLDFGAAIDPSTYPVLVCVSGTRFPNEADAIHAAGGRIVRIVRPGLALDGSHSSETSIDSLPVDGEAVNDGTPEQLTERVRALIDMWWPRA
jgi:hypothetical protein